MAVSKTWRTFSLADEKSPWMSQKHGGLLYIYVNIMPYTLFVHMYFSVLSIVMQFFQLRNLSHNNQQPRNGLNWPPWDGKMSLWLPLIPPCALDSSAGQNVRKKVEPF
jgi:hypothetical protein